MRRRERRGYPQGEEEKEEEDGEEEEEEEEEGDLLVVVRVEVEVVHDDGVGGGQVDTQPTWGAG